MADSNMNSSQPNNRAIPALAILLAAFALLFLLLRESAPDNRSAVVPKDSVHAGARVSDTTSVNQMALAGVVNGVDTTTGLIAAPGLEVVKANCLACHSPKLITQYRGSREDWLGKIRWMQAKQNLWDLGENEPVILDYLSKNYAVHEIHERRPPLEDVQWYPLE